MDMILNWQEDSWMTLAEPAHGRAANPRYLPLLAALDAGWQIARPVWRDTSEQVYHFILKHSEYNGTRLITVPEDEDIREFVRDRRLTTY
jgi:hypothetical protein